MTIDSYVEKYLVFDRNKEFVGGYASVKEVLSQDFPDTHLVYSGGHFIKHIKEFKLLSEEKIEKWEKMLDDLSWAVYILFC